jgi:hypothetical protein
MVLSTTGQPFGGRSLLTIVRLPAFERSAQGKLTEQDHESLDKLLAGQPDAGRVIRGTGGVRKLRVRLAGRGKSGGARIIYFHDAAKQRVYLILVYAKNEKDSLTGREMQQMRRLTAILEAEP